VDVYDPWADPDEVKHEYGIELLPKEPLPDLDAYDAVVLAVAHDTFKSLPIEKNDKRVVFDIKSILDKEKTDGRL
jgi:UDP-N-acetyl-D-galactosamine dehydrogenase